MAFFGLPDSFCSLLQNNHFPHAAKLLFIHRLINRFSIQNPFFHNFQLYTYC